MHCFHHLQVRFEVHKKATFGVDEVVRDPRRDVPQRSLGLQNEAVESIDYRRWYPRIMSMPTHQMNIKALSSPIKSGLYEKRVSLK